MNSKIETVQTLIKQFQPEQENKPANK
jgi:hypothetical protein